jgi:hypothetical protein
MKHLILTLALLIPSSAMAATLSITIPDNQVNRVQDAFANEYGYQEQVLDENGDLVDNPVTKAQFTKSKVVSYIKNTVRSSEKSEAAKTAESNLTSVTLN